MNADWGALTGQTIGERFCFFFFLGCGERKKKGEKNKVCSTARCIKIESQTHTHTHTYRDRRKTRCAHLFPLSPVSLNSRSRLVCNFQLISTLSFFLSLSLFLSLFLSARELAASLPTDLLYNFKTKRVEIDLTCATTPGAPTVPPPPPPPPARPPPARLLRRRLTPPPSPHDVRQHPTILSPGAGYRPARRPSAQVVSLVETGSVSSVLVLFIGVDWCRLLVHMPSV